MRLLGPHTHTHALPNRPPTQVPIIAPVKQKKFEVEEREALPTRYSAEFLASLLATPELIRNVAVVGHLHHGKTLVSASCSCKDI